MDRSPFLWIGFLATVVAAIMVFSLVVGSRMAKHHTPLVEAVMATKVEMSLAHLSFEEIVSGDPHRNIEEVWDHLDRAAWYSDAMLSGGENAKHVIVPLQDPELRRQIEYLGAGIADFRAVADVRWSKKSHSGIGTAPDEYFDAIFVDFLKRADAAEIALQIAMAGDVHRFYLAQGFAIALCTGLFALAGFVLWHSQRKRILDSTTLRDSKRRMDLVLHGAALGTWDWNIQTGKVVFDHYFAEMLGHSLDDFEPHVNAWQGLVHPDDIVAVTEVLTRHLEDKQESYETEHRLRHRSGNWIWVLDRGRVVEWDVDGRPLRMCGTHRDITRRREAEEALRRSEALLADTAQIAKIGGWELEVATLEVSWTDETYRIHELPTSHKPPLEEAIEFYHVDDRPKLKAAVEAAMENGIPYDLEVRFTTARGAPLWIRTTCRPDVVDGRTVRLAGTFQDITERRQAEQSESRLKAAIDAASDTIIISDTNGVVLYTNPEHERVTGYTPEETIGKTTQLLHSGEHDKAFYQDLWWTITSGDVWQGLFTNRKKDGTLLFEDTTISPVKDENGEIINFVAVKRDVTQQRLLEDQLQQARKLESVGQLAAGIAHEINTPTQYVAENTRFVRDRVKDLLKLTHDYASLLAAAKENTLSSEQIETAESALQEVDLDFIRVETPKAIEETLEGVGRVTEIVRAMRDFSHPGGEEKIPADLNKAIESTLIICRNRWSHVADLKIDLEEGLPTVPCHLGEFNQVILNVVVNAADAIGDVIAATPGERGQISINSRRDGAFVEIRIADTGGGIPEEIRQKIFDPFFTTKEVGKGTGQGLAISRSAIVNRHGGTIHVETESGRGSTFIIRLPLSTESTIENRGAA